MSLLALAVMVAEIRMSKTKKQKKKQTFPANSTGIERIHRRPQYHVSLQPAKKTNFDFDLLVLNFMFIKG